MSILIDRDTRVVILGVTGKFGRYSVKDLAACGTKVAAGVSPGREGDAVDGTPVYPAVADAVRSTQANAALVYVPAPVALDAVIEAIEAGCKVVSYPGDGLPVRDAMEMRAAAKANGARLVGPNSPGIYSPGKAKLGFMPTFCFSPGRIGLISRSGSLSYEAAWRLSAAQLGQSTFIGIGGDPVKGISAAEAVECFHSDHETAAVVYLGEIGSSEEYAVAEYAKRSGAKPVAALLVGRTAPPGKKMGHAAAIIGSHADTWEPKVRVLRAAGVSVADSLDDLVQATRDAMRRAGIQHASIVQRASI